MIGQYLSLVGLEKHFGSVRAVTSLSLEIGAGEFVSLVGPSGSGKTTALNMIAGFEGPSAGKIVIGGRDVTHVAPNRRGIGMVFQKYALFPHLTVRQNIAFPLRMQRQSNKTRIATRVEEMLELVQLSSFGERYPQQLSGGQQQRVALARALAFEPPVLLMDEPLGALDKKLREAMQFEIKRLQERLGATVVYVTHDQDEALTMSDRVAVMAGGELKQFGTPTDLYRHPNSAFVADFIGRMNFMEGNCIENAGGTAVVRLSDDTVLSIRAQGLPATAMAGQTIKLAIRPERVRVARRGEGGSGCLAAVVQTCVFVGSVHILVVRLESRPDVLLQIQLPAEGGLPFQERDTVDLLLDDGAIHLFANTERHAA
ncbi:mannopine transport system ATP-binding protein [Ensifer adhaerens]|uniref:Mannopine transport system ATP-binding protein n=1 Tax=Ensifer adhaerens TaxID=106592 RepID=A0ACC5T6B0_ENSAD|nr:ABC transporter ATP-binding protein [Ensifer adhaerens]MBP1876667.1 mannopine transport system ATP-binding protein [Ensifer adhaerens]